MKIQDYKEAARIKAEKMKHPDWEKYSGWIPEQPVAEEPKKKAKAKPSNGDSN
jgi:hypothetical protein